MSMTTETPKTKFSFKQGLCVLKSMQPAYELFRLCENYDKIMPKLYWHTLKERQYDHQAMDYLCFTEDNTLVGMLNILFFSDTAEFTVLVHPDYRGQKMFKKLCQIAIAKLKNYVVSHYMLISPFENPCNREGAVWDHDEVEMRPPEVLPELSLKNPVTITRASLEDIPILASIHVESFEKPDYNAMVERYNTTLREPNRRAFLARNAKGEIVGKIHAREDFNRIYIHDVGIKKEFRQQGYGKALMITWLKQHGNDYPDKPKAVEVLGNNTNALKLYEACGFILTNKYRFWKFEIPSLK
jgi:ribosomal protein S18 acetylase RimI-like enzyme